MLFRLFFFIIMVAAIFFVGYYAGVAGWIPFVSDWFKSWLAK